MRAAACCVALISTILWVICVGLPYAVSAAADDEIAQELQPVPPKTPGESREAIVVHPEFRVELVASEPDVQDPVAVDFDANGRMYVVQLPPYNSYVVDDYTGHGSIRLLEDRDDDGVYEHSRLFADELKYPTAVACWAGGVFVGDAPDLLYLKDTDGDGRADERRVIFTGFGTDKAGEAHLNSIRWGLDNRFYFSTSLSGGDVRVAASALDPTATDAEPPEQTGAFETRSVRGRGFVFDPRDLSHFELTSGGGQHGMCRDDWGTRFVCSNSVPAQVLMYDDRYTARTPALRAPEAAVDIAPDGKYTKLYRISPSEPWRVLRTRLRSEGKFRGSDEGGQPFGFFSAATGITIYRGDAWPAAYQGNLLVGDVANNLVYRAQVQTDGIQYTATRADKGREFLASRDIWFRPVQFANAPDGSLYILDMYRELIEGAAFLPPEFLEHLNALGGNELGRIYRVVPNDFSRRRQAHLRDAATARLVELLEHPNGWHRDTASRLLYERQDRSAVPALRSLVRDSRNPEGRAVALTALAGLGQLDEDVLLSALRDADAHVRRHSVRLAEGLQAESSTLRTHLLNMTDDQSLSVRYQLAWSLGEIDDPRQAQAIARLARRDADNTWMQLALLSSTQRSAGEVFLQLAADATFRMSSAGERFLADLAAQIGGTVRASQSAAVLKAMHALPEEEADRAKRWLSALAENQGAGAGKRLAASDADTERVLNELIDEARRTALEDDAAVARRVDAIRTLRIAGFHANRRTLTDLLDVRQPPQCRAAALEVLGTSTDESVPALILESWSSLTPALRATAVEILLSRSEWALVLLKAIEDSLVRRADIDTARLALLSRHPDATVRNTAAALFADEAPSPRQTVVARYQQSLELKGDIERGRTVFRRVCTACHRLENEGRQVGAELQGIRERGTAAILLNILDPNREVKPKFVSYNLVTTEGRVVSGMIDVENANSVTLRRPDGTTVTVQRSDIELLQSTGLSYMPEGLETEIDPQAMADLLRYLEYASRLSQ